MRKMETSLTETSGKLMEVFRKSLESLPTRDEFGPLIDDFHKLDADEKEKLKQKDKDLVNFIANFKRGVNIRLQAGDITRMEAVLFIAVALIFEQVESILFELKKVTGVVPPNEEPPKPDLPPEPGPTPRTPEHRPIPSNETAGIVPTGEQFRSCGKEGEVEICSSGDGGTEAPPRISITGHSKNSSGVSECAIEFKFYTVRNNDEVLVHTDTVRKGSSTPSRRGRWSRVTAKCLESHVQNSECHISWTEQP